ncbi:MAG: ParB/RepB/Spo0J family partition protein [Candidatus Hydrogenedentes bacterium]|nr:ParB/RepB/Spo0J family partition protein [Candidatus Hydrogenedentota bacterium]
MSSKTSTTNPKNAELGLAPKGDFAVGLRCIPLDRIFEDPENERQSYRDIDELAASIKADGLIEPIVVTAEGGRFKILSGHRRYRAAVQAGLAKIEVVVRHVEDELERRRKRLVTNLQRDDLTVMEIVDAVEAYVNASQDTGSHMAIAETLGKSPSWVSDVLAIKRLGLDLQQQLRKSEVRVPLDTVSRIAREDSAEKQAKLIECLLGGASTNSIRKHLTEGKRPRRESKQVEIEEYVATVTGPKGPQARGKMIEACKALLDKVLAMPSAEELVGVDVEKPAA